jgi:hypothetical protein
MKNTTCLHKSLFLITVCLFGFSGVPAHAELQTLSSDQMETTVGEQGICYKGIKDACPADIREDKTTPLDHLTIIEDMEDETGELSGANSTTMADDSTAAISRKPEPRVIESPYDVETTEAIINAVGQFLRMVQ